MEFKKSLLGILICLYTCTVFAIEGSAGLHLDWIDNSVSPAKNFFNYANGNWQKKNAIPAAYAHWGTIEILQEQNLILIKNLVEAAAKSSHYPPGSLQQKVGDFYLSGMDQVTIDKLGIQPLQQEFQQINAIRNINELQKVLAHLHLIGVSALFDFGQMQDFKNSKKVIAIATQGGITLPDRDYYLKKDEKFKSIRQLYLMHLQKMFVLLGETATTADKKAHVVLTIETLLAKASLPPTMLRNPEAIYHIKNLNQLQQMTSHFLWRNYLTNIHHPEIQFINVGMPDFFKTLNKQLLQVSLEDWKTYLHWHLIHRFSPYLSQPFVDEDFKMSAALSGTKTLLPQWTRVITVENETLGFAVGQLYVDKYFSPAAKKAAKIMLNNIKISLRHDLQQLPWMNPQTKKAAIHKLDLMEERIGYPDQWRDYSTLKIDRGPYVLNVMRANEFLVQHDLNKIGKPIDKTEWDITPQEVNAYYDASMNRLNIPAGILKPPFYDPDAPAAVNYGAIGFVIGHEMTHGFDDQGAKFDGHGNLKNWWSKESLKNFRRITDLIAEQYSHYTIAGSHIQGELVTEEATADLGGLTLAYKALHRSTDFKNAKTIQGFTPDQQFFLGAAHVWATNVRPEEARHAVLLDSHPPAIFRVNGTMADMKEFQQAFHLADNNIAMVNPNRHNIW